MRKTPKTVLMVDVGGGSVKLMLTGKRLVRSFDSGDSMTAAEMARRVLKATHDWSYDVISIGYPGLLCEGKPVEDPPRVGRGWVGFDYAHAFGCPVRFINDAGMQALAAYKGHRMLFLGLGTGLGSAFVADDVLVPLELGWLRFDSKRSLLEELSDDGLQRLGLQRWRRNVIAYVGNLAAAFWIQEIVLGGGNAARLKSLPKHWRIRTNAHALLGAERLWGDKNGVLATPRGSIWEIRGLK